MGEILAYIFVFLMWISSIFSTAPDMYKVHSYKVGSHTLYIPYTFVHYGTGKPNSERALLVSYFPGNAPLPKDGEKRSLEQNLIRIKLMPLNKKVSNFLDKSYKSFTLSSKATYRKGKKYNLNHYTQDPAQKIGEGLDDIYVSYNSDGSVNTLLICSKDAPLPSCSMRFYSGDFSYELFIDMRKIKNWEILKTNVVKLTDSFNSPEKAVENINQFLPEEVKIKGA